MEGGSERIRNDENYTDSVDEDHLFWISLLSKTTFMHTYALDEEAKELEFAMVAWGRRLGRKMRMDMNRNRTTAIVT